MSKECAMQVNADFRQRVLVRFAQSDWVPSPVAGVNRRMLDRIGGEVARATSIVRFDAGSAFSAHIHDGGEEYLVLDGTFQDESGDFPAGFYVRNPPTSAHRPAARDGAVILVKLHQFDPADRQQVQIDTRSARWAEVAAGIAHLPLFAAADETVRLERWAPGAARHCDAAGGLELFVLDGSVAQGGDVLTRWDWLRLPVGAHLTATAGPQGAQVWIKSGHLRQVTAPAP